MKTKLKPVQSSNVKAVGYDKKRGILIVQFKAPKPDKPAPVYEYAKVPRSEYDALLKAESVGKRMHSHIIGKFEAEKIEEGD
jgi:hypothetical protein